MSCPIRGASPASIHGFLTHELHLLARIGQLCANFLGSLSVEMEGILAILGGQGRACKLDISSQLEGRSVHPVRCVLPCGCRLDKLDLGTAGYLDEVTGKVMRGTDIRGAPPAPL